MGIKSKIFKKFFAKDVQAEIIKASRLFPVLYQEYESTLGVEGDADAEAYTKTYSSASWVYVCVRKIAQTCAMMADELKFYKKVGNEIEEIKQGEIVELFDQVNPFISKTELIESVVSHRLLNGNAYWAIEGNGKKEIYPLRPDRIKIIPDAKEFIRAYDYSINGKTIRFDADEIIHFKYFNAENDYYGLSPLAVARNILTLDFHALTWNKNFFKNSARPDGTLETDGSLSESNFERTKKSWAEAHQGTDKAHRIAILEGGLKYHATGLSPKDVEFLELRQMTMREVFGIFGMYPAIAGVYERGSNFYATSDVQERMYWRLTVIPELKAIANTFNEKFIQKKIDPKSFCKFNLSNVIALKEDEEKKMTVARGLVTANIQTINEVRKDMYNKEPLEWGDQPVQQIPMSLSFGGSQKAIAEAIHVKAISYTPKEEVHWKKFDATLTGYENHFKQKVLEFLDEQKQRILKNVAEFLNTSYLSLSIRSLSEKMNLKFSDTELDQIFDLLKENGLLGDMSKAEFIRIMTGIGKATALELGVDFDYSPLTPQIEAWLRTKIQRYVQSVNKSIRQEVADVIVKGLDEGLGTHAISGNIADHLDQTKDYRSDRIARTELLGVSNKARWEAFKQSGAVKEKQWIGTMDDRIRDTHAMAHGQIKGIDEYFNVGSDLLMFPGDIGGSAENTINCRCTIMAMFEE